MSPPTEPSLQAGAAAAGPPAVPWPSQYLLLSLIWGLSFLFIKVGDTSLAPVQVALGRLLTGALTLLLILVLRREPLPRSPRTWGHLAVDALLLNAAPFTRLAYGELRVSSILAGIWNATTPILVAIGAVLILPDERPSVRRLASLVIGFAGVVVVLGAWRGISGGDLAGDMLCLAAAGCYGLGLPYARRHLAGRPESSLSLSAAQLTCATVLVGLLAPFVSGGPDRLTAPAVLALGVLGTGVAYVLNYGIIRRAGATTASTVTYVVPVFATLAGVLVLQEPMSWNQPAGAVLILLGAGASQAGPAALARLNRRIVTGSACRKRGGPRLSSVRRPAGRAAAWPSGSGRGSAS
ncbi:MAG TPA: DMT family transporter [Candidatus Dormibacteraeota bacterium]|jgi:drug/metabolite transporter (DMT)-like permease|nr:DMT family transporter [Candidatus Dormibacteraeota bacterium]